MFDVDRPSMSQGTVIHARHLEKDFTVATPEEFVKKFKGTKVINKVSVKIVTNTYKIVTNTFWTTASAGDRCKILPAYLLIVG